MGGDREKNSLAADTCMCTHTHVQHTACMKTSKWLQRRSLLVLVTRGLQRTGGLSTLVAALGQTELQVSLRESVPNTPEPAHLYHGPPVPWDTLVTCGCPHGLAASFALAGVKQPSVHCRRTAQLQCRHTARAQHKNEDLPPRLSQPQWCQWAGQSRRTQLPTAALQKTTDTELGHRPQRGQRGLERPDPVPSHCPAHSPDPVPSPGPGPIPGPVPTLPCPLTWACPLSWPLSWWSHRSPLPAWAACACGPASLHTLFTELLKKHRATSCCREAPGPLPP